MTRWLRRLLRIAESEQEQEHRISLPGLEIAFNHTTRTVFMVDQTGAEDTEGLLALEKCLKAQGWFIHCVVVEAITPAPIKKE